MSERATESDIGTTERVLGVELPAEYRALLSVQNGWEQWCGEVFLMINGTDSLVAVNQVIELHPGFLVFASDGSRELIGFDLRQYPSPVAMMKSHLPAGTMLSFRLRHSTGSWTNALEAKTFVGISCYAPG